MNIQLSTQKTILTEDVFHLGVKTIIHNSNGKILVLKVHKGTKQYWDLPGGRVQIGETSEQTATREAYEETGITHINNLHHVGMITSRIRIQLASDHDVGLIFSFYTGTVSTDQVTLSAEHYTFSWVTPEEAVRLLESVYGPTFKSYMMLP